MRTPRAAHLKARSAAHASQPDPLEKQSNGDHRWPSQPQAGKAKRSEQAKQSVKTPDAPGLGLGLGLVLASGDGLSDGSSSARRVRGTDQERDGTEPAPHVCAATQPAGFAQHAHAHTNPHTHTQTQTRPHAPTGTVKAGAGSGTVCVWCAHRGPVSPPARLRTACAPLRLHVLRTAQSLAERMRARLPTPEFAPLGVG